MGWALARSITGNVHALFQGTERLRLGDLGHRIPHPQPRSARRAGRVVQRDDRQHRGRCSSRRRRSGASRRSCASPARSRCRCCRDSAAPMAGLALAALCVPAREVGGDYYDFFTLGPRRARPARRRRGRQGDLGRALHGGAEGADALAQPDPRVAAPAADRGQPDHRGEPRQPQLHHHDLRRRRPRAADADLRAGRPHAARCTARRRRRRRRALVAPSGMVVGPAARWPRASLRRAARGSDGPARRRRRVPALHRRR